MAPWEFPHGISNTVLMKIQKTLLHPETIIPAN